MKNKVRKILVQLSETGLVCLAESLFNHCNYLDSSICEFIDLWISSTGEPGGGETLRLVLRLVLRWVVWLVLRFFRGLSKSGKSGNLRNSEETLSSPHTKRCVLLCRTSSLGVRVWVLRGPRRNFCQDQKILLSICSRERAFQSDTVRQSS